MLCILVIFLTILACDLSKLNFFFIFHWFNWSFELFIFKQNLYFFTKSFERWNFLLL